MSNKIALVTGGAGFIGSHVVDLLIEKNYKVRIIDDLSGGREENLKKHKNNPRLVLEKKNICNLKDNESIFKDVQHVFHFAGKGDIVPSIENPVLYLETNFNGTMKVLESSKNVSVNSFVYAASSSCYGLASTPTDEKHAINPLYPYALSKYFGEQICLHWQKVYNLPVNSIRIFNAYGNRVKTTGAYGAVFGVFFKQKIEQKPFTIVGDGEQKRDFVNVKDVAEAFYLVSNSSTFGEIYNLGSGKPQTINYLIQLIDGLNAKKIFLPKRPGEPDITWANINKISNKFNWSPKISFNEGVKNMLNNIDNWNNAPLWDEDSINQATKVWFKYMKG
ncbi:MAG: UDP-N-acetylglucosamine 4-epimerase [Alphaproteobacteria bacterium MarineAlpha5_Bin8]|nr:MAG: UDP-N-acetylglucosamine 4-epimerase [Alphaproteobacteria bacterium MarineAlpha5_Bin8]PPR54554.1 MAG: UDP-N-acetylglucosamine 4-epimerase [Alphaproteobacteria bacterium MarineAlpha5_Bin6]|tara:strand:- start:1596 stop:2597 length:1002 start_codon:yes stop_codon:yes gene_type:complete